MSSTGRQRRLVVVEHKRRVMLGRGAWLTTCALGSADPSIPPTSSHYQPTSSISLSRGALFSQCPYKNAVRLAVVYTKRHHSSSSSFEIRSFLLTVNQDYPIKVLAHLSHWQAININQSLNYSTQSLRICNRQYLNLKRIEFNIVYVKKKSYTDAKQRVLKKKKQNSIRFFLRIQSKSRTLGVSTRTHR